MATSTINDYTTLTTAVADFLDRLDLSTQVPLFIQLCEAGLNRDLRTHNMVCKGQTVGARQDEFIPLPDDWLETRNVEVITLKENPDDPPNLIDDETFQATYQSPDAIDQMKQQNIQWRPEVGCHYTYYGNVIEIYPDPGKDFRVVMEYYQKIPPLTVAAPTNHLILSDPDVYLYGSLIHSAPFLRDDPRLPVWGSLYTSAMAALNRTSEKAMTSGSRLTRKTNTVM
jgi:hypothetical protein